MFDFLSRHCYNLLASNLGGWLNGRAAVSKTAGCVFESRPPCQKTKSQDLVFCLCRAAILTRNLSATATKCLASTVASNVQTQCINACFHYSVALLLTNRVPPAKRSSRKAWFFVYAGQCVYYIVRACAQNKIADVCRQFVFDAM